MYNERVLSAWKFHSDSIAVRSYNMDLTKIPLDTPAMKPPNGVTPNFEHPRGMGSEVYTTLFLSIVISTVFVWTRLYTKHFIIKTHGWEDCMFDAINSV